MPFLFPALLAAFYYINFPAIEIREHPSKDSEVVSQALYSESVNLLEESGEWVKIETSVDHYQGWIRKNGLLKLEEPYQLVDSALVAKVSRNAAHLYHVEDTIYGPILTLPFESKLEVIWPKEKSNSRWLKVRLLDGQEAYIQRGDVTFTFSLLSVDEMCELSRQFLGLPYTWGGRSSFGYDCSGFVQMLYRQRGIYLPRNSKDQFKFKDLEPTSFAQLIKGDLIFFGLAENKIKHVGLYLGDNQFIHATVKENAPYIHISRLSDPEWNGSGEYTYKAARTYKHSPN